MVYIISYVIQRQEIILYKNNFIGFECGLTLVKCFTNFISKKFTYFYHPSSFLNKELLQNQPSFLKNNLNIQGKNKEKLNLCMPVSFIETSQISEYCTLIKTIKLWRLGA